MKLNTVVIDPGHGGNDPGSISKDKKTLEKNLTLTISKALAEKIRTGCPDVKVVLTRDRDVFVPLADRARKANNVQADLFISIHINSVKSTAANGFSSHILGQSSVEGRDLYQNNFNECARENSVVLLEDDYSTNYQGFDPDNPESSILFSLMQNAHLEQSLNFACLASENMSKGPFSTSRGVRQDPFLVLWKTTMPSVLVECGFISNSSDLQILNSEKGIAEIVQRLYDAFVEFKQSYDLTIDSQSEAPEPAPVRQEAPLDWYGTQILALSRQLPSGDPAFKGIDAQLVIDGNIYRYIAGGASTPEAAEESRKNIKKKFPDAFAVKVSGNRVERYRK
ncbi:MAG: N-acetylmuramoyl-L-alanine amidase [Candidatus Cryptobacteroides sp.]